MTLQKILGAHCRHLAPLAWRQLGAIRRQLGANAWRHVGDMWQQILTPSTHSFAVSPWQVEGAMWLHVGDMPTAYCHHMTPRGDIWRQKLATDGSKKRATTGD